MIALRRSTFDSIFDSLSEGGCDEEGALTVGNHDTNLLFVPSIKLRCWHLKT